MPPIVPNLWFDTQAEQAAAFYVSVFPNSRIVATSRYTDAGPGEPGSVMTVEFEALRRHQRRPALHVRRGGVVPGHLR